MQNHIDGVGGPENIDIVLVSHGPAVKRFVDIEAVDKVRGAVAKLQEQGVEFEACANTLTALGIEPDELLPDFVIAEKGGVTRIAELQSQGLRLHPALPPTDTAAIASGRRQEIIMLVPAATKQGYPRPATRTGCARLANPTRPTEAARGCPWLKPPPTSSDPSSWRRMYCRGTPGLSRRRLPVHRPDDLHRRRSDLRPQRQPGHPGQRAGRHHPAADRSGPRSWRCCCSSRPAS
jgi:intracellular sulfur oxidation DsrE/DsrF family protein